MKHVHLGFEVGTGKSVEIPIGHMIVTGMTQQAGKTTALEALIQRSELRAVTFVTKRGESAFSEGRRMQPFFRERADWVFVSSLIDVTMGEKNKMLRAWLMKVCRGTKTLAEVQRNVIAAKEKARGFSESIYTEIEGYLELVVPQLALLPPARAVKIGDGLNVMDLSPYKTELQALVIKSVLEHIHEHETGCVTVIPEAWEFLPEGRGSPVKREAETLIRKGASLRNFVWLDSQDLAGVWKTAVRASSVYLIGVQREANEIKRTLANIPGSFAKPKAADIGTLERGQFYACFGRQVTKTYVQPVFFGETLAKQIAVTGVMPTPEEKTDDMLRQYYGTDGVEPLAPAPSPPEPTEESDMSAATEAKLDKLIDLMTQSLTMSVAIPRPPGVSPDLGCAPAPAPLPEAGDELYVAFRERLLRDPKVLKVLATIPEIELTQERVTLEIDMTSAKGMVGKLLAEGFADKPTSPNALWNEIKRRWNYKGASARIYEQCQWFHSNGFLTKEADGYVVVPAMKRAIK